MPLTLTAEFEWEISTDKRINVKLAEFGDGYKEISVPMGINNEVNKHSVKFWFTSIANFKTFLDAISANKGKPVYWTHPLDNAPKLYRIVNYAPSLQSPTYNECSMVLEDWFGNAI